MGKVLMVEDDLELARNMKELFATSSLILEHAASAEDAYQLLQGFEYDLLLLDWDLPGMTGVDLCRKYRQNGGLAYIVFLTGHHSTKCKVEALDAGADDYVTKPFDHEEVLARMRSLKRRSLNMNNDLLKVGDVSFDPATRTFECEQGKVRLTAKESAILEYLIRHPDRPFTAQRLLNAIWASETDASVETVRVWMRYLRIKLEKLGQDNLIKTVVGSGYVIESDTTSRT